MAKYRLYPHFRISDYWMELGDLLTMYSLGTALKVLKALGLKFTPQVA